MGISNSLYKPLVSIIIPVYNGSDYLNQAIDSALGQSYKNIEVIVINDGSSDNGKTEQIAVSYGEKIKYYSKENGGVSTALNYGIQVMKGEYFSWLSHDDVFYPDKIEKQINFLSKLEKSKAILYGDFEVIDKDSKHLNYRRYKSIEPEKFPYYLLKDLFINGCALLIPAQCVSFDRFDEKLRTTQDNDLWMRLSKKYEFIHLPEIVLKSRYHANQCTYSIPSHQDEVLEFYKYHTQAYSEGEWLKISGEKSIRSFYYSLAIGTLKNGLLVTSKYFFGVYLDNRRLPLFVNKFIKFIIGKAFRIKPKMFRSWPIIGRLFQSAKKP